MNTSDFYYELPEALIAQTPLLPRDYARMLCYDTETKTLSHKHFYDLIDMLNSGDVLVSNCSKVIPARIYGTVKDREAVVEILLLKKLAINTYECLVKPGKKFKEGAEIVFGDNLSAKVIEVKEDGNRVLKFTVTNGDLLENEFDRIGEMPLPPYIHKKLKDENLYQTVYAKVDGSSAAPTAGLHFTNELIEKLKAKGVQMESVILHVGLGTFRPVKVDKIENHKMHSEEYYLDEQTAKRLNDAKKEGRRIIAVGTTTVRVLETLANENGTIKSGHGETSIFLYPPYKFRFVDDLITNFHLPESTLLMLVSCMTTREELLNHIYKTAVEEKYRFFSFGDCMFITTKGTNYGQ